jgi:hypothetical protein
MSVSLLVCWSVGLLICWSVGLLVRQSVGLAGNVNILDVFKRLILKTYLCVVLMCQPNMANMLPTLQLLMFFFSRHMSCCVIDCQHVSNATTSQCGRGTTREAAVQ